MSNILDMNALITYLVLKLPKCPGNLLDMGPLRKCLPRSEMGTVVPTHLCQKLWD